MSRTPSPRHPGRTWLAISMSAVLALAACSSDGSSGDSSDEVAWAEENIPGLDASLVEAACDEGELSLYNVIYRGELAGLISQFEETFPCITVTSFAAGGAQLLERFESEALAGRNAADVWASTTPGIVRGLAEDGLLAEYTPPNADRVPEGFKDEGLWYAVGLDPIGIGWNADRVTPEQLEAIERIENWSDVADPAFSGRAGMVTARGGGTAQLPFYYWWTEVGPEYYAELAALSPAIFDTTNPSVDRMVAGDFEVLLHAPVDNSVASAWLQGAPVQWKFPQPGLAVPHFATVAESAPNPNVARLFVAWSLSPEGQATWSAETGLAPVGADVEDTRPQVEESWYEAPSEYHVVDWEHLTSEVPAMGDEFDRVFN